MVCQTGHSPEAEMGAADCLILTKGSVVEVGSDEEGFKDAWYLATVIDNPFSSKPSSKRKKKDPSFSPNAVHVEYRTLFADQDGSSPLRELVDSSFVRPLPPPDSDLGRAFQLNDVVDANFRDGWWTGVITKVLKDSKYVVTFQNPPDDVQFDASDLRVHLDWVNGRWVRQEKQRRKGLFAVEEKVEVSFEGKDYQDLWFPAIVLEDLGNDSFLVEYTGLGIGDLAVIQKVPVDCFHIRPSPPFSSVKSFVLLQKVDAFYDYSWSSGVINKELSDDRYVVFFKHSNTEREFSRTKLRPHMEWKDGKWLGASQEIVVSSVIQGSERVACSNAKECDLAASLGSPCSTVANSVERASPSADSREKQTESSYPCNGKLSEITLVENYANQMPSDNHAQSVEALSFVPQQLDSKYAEIPFKDSNVLFSGSAPKSRRKSCVGCSLAGDFPSAKAEKHSQRKIVDKQFRVGDFPAVDSGKRKRRLLKSILGTSKPVAGKEGSHSENAVKHSRRNELTPKNDLIIDVICNETRVSGVKKTRQFYLEECGNIMKDQMLQLSNPEMEKNMVSHSGGLEKSKRKRGRPRKVLVETPPVTNRDFQSMSQERTAETEIGSLGSMSEDQPLSTWLEGIQSPAMIDGPIIFPHSTMTQCKEVEKDVLVTSSRADNNEVAPSEIRQLPFEKNIRLWEAIESVLDIFKRIPQKPHFHPLSDRKDSSREGLAIGCMVTFSCVAEKTSKMQFDDPRSTIEDNLEMLAELESFGFDVRVVRDRLTRLLLLKDNQEELQGKIRDIGSQIHELNLKKVDMDRVLNEIDQQIRELKEKREIVYKTSGVSSCEVSNLQSRLEEVGKGMEKVCTDFESLVATPW